MIASAAAALQPHHGGAGGQTKAICRPISVATMADNAGDEPVELEGLEVELDAAMAEEDYDLCDSLTQGC